MEMDAAAFQESTLDEPVWNTIKRDLGLIGRRLKLVILPKVTAVSSQATSCFRLNLEKDGDASRTKRLGPLGSFIYLYDPSYRAQHRSE